MPSVITSQLVETIASIDTVTDVVTIGIQGPQGPTGTEVDVDYAERTDVVDPDVSPVIIYKGKATVGTLDADPGWKLSRLTIYADDDVVTEWADGPLAGYNNSWDDRAVQIYT